MIKKLLLLAIAVSTAFGTLFYSVPIPIAHSQGEMEVQCGQIVEAEFTDNVQEHIYLLDRDPREGFEVSVEPFGDFLNTVIAIYGPSGLLIGYTDNEDGINWAGVTKLPAIASGILSARGQYKIRVANTPISDDKLVDNQRYFGGIGLYTLSIGCTQSNGETIEPGTSATVAEPAPTPKEQAGAQTSIAPEPVAETLVPFLEVGKTYEIAFGSQTKTVTLVELRNDGWAQVEVDGRVGWLNINQVALIMPID